mgnify:CR=1 FL=1
MGNFFSSIYSGETEEFSKLKTSGAPAFIAIFDIDNFKRINDTYGHDCGDYVLREISKLIVKYFSPYCVSRFGGEEFCVFFADRRAGSHKFPFDHGNYTFMSAYHGVRLGIE